MAKRMTPYSYFAELSPAGGSPRPENIEQKISQAVNRVREQTPEPKIVYVDKPYLSVADARAELANYNNKEFALVFSSGFFECLEESELASVISETNRIAKYQYHCFMANANPEWYLFKPLSWWVQQGFTKNKTLLKVICRDEELLV